MPEYALGVDATVDAMVLWRFGALALFFHPRLTHIQRLVLRTHLLRAVDVGAPVALVTVGLGQAERMIAQDFCDIPDDVGERVIPRNRQIDIPLDSFPMPRHPLDSVVS